MSRALPGMVPNLPGREHDIAESMWDGALDLQDKTGYEIFSYDNRSERRGDPDEGSLMVLGEPLEVRPRPHRGYQYKIVDDKLSVSLEDLPKEAKKSWKSLHVKTLHRFCIACKDVLEYYCRYRAAQQKKQVLVLLVPCLRCV